MPIWRAWACLGLALAPAVGSLPAQSASAPGVEIRTVSGSDDEKATKAQLERLLTTLPLQQWLFTRTVQIQDRTIPHSHPVLTIGSNAGNDTSLAATFVHEQLHWFLETPMTDSAIADLRKIYPKVPWGPPDGARNEYSTYLHLLVGLLEFDGTAALYGEEAARRTLGGWRHYQWIYREVLERPAPIRAVLEARGLAKPDARLRRKDPSDSAQTAPEGPALVRVSARGLHLPNAFSEGAGRA